MDVSAESLINAFQQQFPKEFMICYQAIQIENLQKQVQSTSPQETSPQEDE